MHSRASKKNVLLLVCVVVSNIMIQRMGAVNPGRGLQELPTVDLGR
jgi:hypothetical protein